MSDTESITVPEKKRVLRWALTRTNVTGECLMCGTMIGKGKNCFRRDVENNEFRGDDTVYVMHVRCFSGLKKACKIVEEGR